MLLVHGRYVCQQLFGLGGADTPSPIGREEDPILSSEYPRFNILSYYYPPSFSSDGWLFITLFRDWLCAVISVLGSTGSVF